MNIAQIYEFEKLRDGGSLIVSFQADDSCEYWVMFPIDELDIETPKFLKPLLINRTTLVEVELSLEGANAWLKSLKSYFEERPELPYVSKQSEYVILNKMLALCAV